MLRKIVLVFLFFLFINFSFAHEIERSLDDILNDIMKKQNITDIKLIDCNKVLPSEFEEIGDAIMEKMMGNHTLHEQMHEMMGGEQSPMTKNMHISMGRNWINCGDGMNMMTMMMGMMGSPQFSGNYQNYFTLTQIALITSVVSLISTLILIFILFHELKNLRRKLKIK